MTTLEIKMIPVWIFHLLWIMPSRVLHRLIMQYKVTYNCEPQNLFLVRLRFHCYTKFLFSGITSISNNVFSDNGVKPLVIKILLIRAEARVIIGRGGQEIKEIRRESGITRPEGVRS